MLSMRQYKEAEVLMTQRFRARLGIVALYSLLVGAGCSLTNGGEGNGPNYQPNPHTSNTDPRINEIQFVGSHNSYKQAMSAEHSQALKANNPKAWASLDYEHLPLGQQLDLGMRKLELDVFYRPETADFAVGHVQVIDMRSHCQTLKVCLSQLTNWSNNNRDHAPIWISFNTKDQAIPSLPTPPPFTPEALTLLDQVLETGLGGRLIRPRDITNLTWPKLSEAQGKFLLILDEQGAKREAYLSNWRARPMFTNSPADHPAAAVMIINDPIADASVIRSLVKQGYLVRTRADADTVEARQNDTRRRDAAFASGAQAISTDYYLPSTRFASPYQVSLPNTTEPIRCNPINAPKNCLTKN